MAEAVVLSAKQIQQAIDQLVSQISKQENLQDPDLAFVGIRTHGSTLARRILDQLNRLHPIRIPLGILDITLYRDDLGGGQAAPVVRPTELGFDIEAKKIILVDDVLYTGRTVRAALNALTDYGRPKLIKLAVLIDRGGRELPIAAQYVGMSMNLDAQHMIKLYLHDDDNQEAAVIRPKG